MEQKNDESTGMYNKDNQIIFKTPMLRSTLGDYNNIYILVKGAITVSITAADTAAAKNVIFKNCAQKQ